MDTSSPSPDAQSKQHSTSSVHTAISEGDDHPVRQYLQAGGDPNLADRYTKITELQQAARCRQPHIVRLLIQAGARPNTLDNLTRSPLIEAVDEHMSKGIPDAPPDKASQSLEIVKLLVEAGASLDGLDRPFSRLSGNERSSYHAPLALAARFGNVEVVRYLLEQGAAVDIQDDGGMTPLHHAVRERQTEATRRLIAAGADVNLSYRPGLTPLLVALALAYREEYKKHTFEMVRLLIQSGADPNKTEPDGSSPLMAAVRTGDHALVSLLLSLGANVHHRDDRGDGVLHHAINVVGPVSKQEREMAPIIETLLAAGADPAVPNNDGQTARDVARERRAARLEALV